MDGSGWVLKGLPSGADGRVSFTTPLQPNSFYLIVEETAPAGFVIPADNWEWTFETDATGNITSEGILIYGAYYLPEFVLNPTPENPGWHVGNVRLPTNLEFIKTNHLLYAYPPQVVELPGAEFILARYNEDTNNWVYVETAISDNNGVVSFTAAFTENGEYRLQEITPPAEHNLPPGYWRFSTNATGGIDGNINFIPSSILEGDIGSYFAFIYDPTEENEGWHVGNVPTRYWPIIKTNFGIYTSEPYVYRGGAEFLLVVYNGTGQPEDDVLVTSDMIGDVDEGYAWSYIATRTSYADGRAMMFPMMPGRVYQLIETAPPAGYQPPNGQWRIRVEAYPTMPAGRRLLVENIGNPPDMLDIYDNGYYYIGNMPNFYLPLAGGRSVMWFTVIGLTSVFAAITISIFAARKKVKAK